MFCTMRKRHLKAKNDVLPLEQLVLMRLLPPPLFVLINYGHLENTCCCSHNVGSSKFKLFSKIWVGRKVPKTKKRITVFFVLINYGHLGNTCCCSHNVGSSKFKQFIENWVGRKVPQNVLEYFWSLSITDTLRTHVAALANYLVVWAVQNSNHLLSSNRQRQIELVWYKLPVFINCGHLEITSCCSRKLSDGLSWAVQLQSSNHPLPCSLRNLNTVACRMKVDQKIIHRKPL